MRSLLILILILSSANAFADQVDGLPALRFSEVAKGKLFRGGEPPLWQLEELKTKHGIKTIISIDSDEVATVKERALAESLGIKHIWLPLPSIFYPKDKQVSKILKAMSDPKNYPVYIHCYHGRDRTGLMIGLYRVFKQRWFPERAYNEMLDFDFITYNMFYQAYWNDKTRHLALYP